MKHKNMANGNR